GDPYAIYSRYILRLKKLDPLEQEPDAAVRGVILHNILERFVNTCPAALPENAQEILTELAREEIAKRHDDPAVWNFWWPRFERLAQHYITFERQWRREPRLLKTEA